MTINASNPLLAANGGQPSRLKPWLDNFTTGVEEKQAVLSVLDSGYISLYEGSNSPDPPFSFLGGPEVQALENDWSGHYNVGHSVAFNSATSCLYASIAALGVGYGDEVIVSPYTMSACALAPLIYGAIPVFADVDPRTGCLDPISVEQKISPRTRAILVVHQFGFPADMDSLCRLAKEYGLSIIEDCAQAHGALYKGKLVGTIGDIGVFSLNVNKTIQSGEGGMCTTASPELAYRLQLIRNHGEAVVGPAGYTDITNIAGFNYRMTEMTAAVARVQLSKLQQLTDQRLSLVNYLRDFLSSVDFLTPLGNHGDPLVKGTYYLFTMTFNEEVAGISRSHFSSLLKAEGIPLSEGYVRPLYLQPLYQQRHLFKHGYPFTAPPNVGTYQDYSFGICPVAEDLHFHKLLASEHIRPPHSLHDISCFIDAISKLCNF